MRWYWIDRYTEFESGKHAAAIKGISLSEDHLHDHFPGAAIMPNSLILEGMAQTAGLLVSEYFHFRRDIVLAKVARATFHGPVFPGETLSYRAQIEDLKEDGAFTTIKGHVGSRLQSEAEVFFACLQRGSGGRKLFESCDLLAWLRGLHVFTVGVGRDGQRITETAVAAALAAD